MGGDLCRPSTNGETHMNKLIIRAICAALLTSFSSQVLAAPAIAVLGRDVAFPNHVEAVPGKLSDFKGLQINSFETNDGAKLSYWETGKG
jgi:hypothetical protein